MAAKATILIVDKEKILVDLMVHALKSMDLSVVGANSVEHARRLRETHSPDLVVIDPTIEDGSAFIESLRQQTPSVKIVTLIDKSQGLEGLVEEIRISLDTELSSLFGNESAAHVLIVDDEVEIRDVVAEFLGGCGYRISVGQNGREAIERIRLEPSIKIVLLDVSMPEMGGLEALAEIMAKDPHPNVLMMTAVADREVARRALTAGAFDYILKPFDVASIENSIVACLSHTEYQKEPWWKRLTRR